MSDTHTIKIVIDGQSAARGARDVENSLGRVGNAAGGLNRSLGGLSSGFSRLNTVAVVGAGSAILTGFVKMADASKKLTSQLSLVESSLKTVNDRQNDLVSVSLRTGTSLQANTELYAKMRRALRDTVGATGNYVRATETVSKAMAISGTSSEAAAGAIAQLGQALASGTLRGDEFNSVNEAAPRLMELLADSMGKPVGALRKMAEEGKLTSDKLYKALTDPKFTAKIDREFGQIPMTFGRAMENIETLATYTFGKFDEGGQFSNMMLGFADTSKTNFEQIGNDAADLGIRIRSAFEVLGDVFDPMAEAGSAALDMLGFKAKTTAEYIRQIFEGIDDVNNNETLKGAARFVNRTIDFGGSLFGADLGFTEAGDAKMANRSNRAAEYDRAVERRQQDYRMSHLPGAGPNFAADFLAGRVDALGNPIGGNGRRAGAGGNDADAERAAKRAQREREQAQAALDRRLADMGREVELAGLTTLEAERQRELYDLRDLAAKAVANLDEERVRSLQEQKSLLEGAAQAMRTINELASQPIDFVDPNFERVANRYSTTGLDPYDFSVGSGRTLADANAQFQRDRDAINFSTFSAEQKDKMLEDLADKQKKVAQEFEARHLDAIDNIASAFGGKMGDAVSRVVGILKSINSGDFDGSQLGGKAGALAGLANQFTGGKFAKDIGERFKKSFNLNELKAPLESMKRGFGDFTAMVKGGDVMGLASAAGAGAAQGQMVDGVFKALGVKSSKLGAQIGGSIGNAIGGPIGGFIGSALGGIVGGAFKKTPKAKASLGSVDAFGELNIGKATGDKKLRDTVDAMASSFESSLKNIQSLVGADLAGGTALGTLGAKGKKLFYTAPGGSKRNVSTAEDAVDLALKDVLNRGVLTGISDFSQRVLRSAEDLERAATLAGKYETVLRELSILDDPITGPMKELSKSFEKLSGQMKAAGATTAELANVERYYSLKRKELLDDSISDLLDFKKSLSGENSGVPTISRLNTALSEFAAFERDIAAGKSIDQARFTSIGQEAFGLARDLYGTATSEFQTVRDRLLTATGGAIGNAQSAFDAANTPVVQAIDNGNAQIVQQLQIMNDLMRAVVRQNPDAANVYGATVYRAETRFVNGGRADLR